MATQGGILRSRADRLWRGMRKVGASRRSFWPDQFIARPAVYLSARTHYRGRGKAYALEFFLRGRNPPTVSEVAGYICSGVIIILVPILVGIREGIITSSRSDRLNSHAFARGHFVDGEIKPTAQRAYRLSRDGAPYSTISMANWQRRCFLGSPIWGIFRAIASTPKLGLAGEVQI